VGQLGQRRRQVRDARAELTAFADRWRPIHPDLPTDPVELAWQVRLLNGRRIAEQIDAYVARQMARAHPGEDTHRQVERTAWATYAAAEQTRAQLDNAMYAELRPYGRAAHVLDPGGRLTIVSEGLDSVKQDLHGATARVQRLQNEQAIRGLPAGVLDTVAPPVDS
jgi:hypothetical protein